MDKNLRKTQNLNRRRNETENNRGDYYDGDKNPSVSLGTNAIDGEERSVRFALVSNSCRKSKKLLWVLFFFFWINFFWVWEELKLEREGEILGFCFSGRNSIRALSIVLSRRERGEREEEREI